MLLGIAFKVTLLSLLLLTVLVPVRLRLLAADRAARLEGPFSRHPVIGLLEPLAHFLDAIARDASTGEPARFGRTAATTLVFVAPLTAFAVLPFGSRYRLGEGEVELVVAHLDWGIVWLMGSLLLSLYGGVLLFDRAAARVRYGIATASYAVAAGFALAGLAMAMGSIDPLEIVVAQDATLAIGHFFGPALSALQALELPAWGIFLQPISLLLFCVSVVAVPHVGAAQRAHLTGSALNGDEDFLLELSEQLAALSVAAIVVVLFLGGGALPYVSANMLIAAVEPHFGSEFATLLCMATHLGTFVAKLVLVTFALESLRQASEPASFEHSLARCWTYLIPACVANLWITGDVLVRGGLF